MKARDVQGVNPPAPVFRLWACGPLLLERGDGTDVPVKDWGGSQDARRLLRKLIASPERCARRDDLVEALWPEDDPAASGDKFYDAVYHLRKVLKPTPQAESLLLAPDKSGYRLPGQDQLWVDADAALELLTQVEQQGRSSAPALPFLREAVAYLNRGPFLEEEEGQWATGRRATLERAHYRARLWLAQAYAQQGMPGQAEIVLSALLEEDVLDEDVLCRLMGLLHRQGMTYQALRLYERMGTVFAREQLEFTEATKSLAAGLQEERYHLAMDPMVTEEPPALTPASSLAHVIQLSQTQHMRVHETVSAEQGSAQHTPITREMQRLAPANSSIQPTNSPFQIQQADNGLLDITDLRRVVSEEEFCNIRSDGLQEDSSWITFLHLLPAEQVALLISLLKRDANGMAHDVGKRETLRHIVAALSLIATGQSAMINSEPWERLIRARMQRAALNEETLNHFEHLLGVCWDLSNTQALEVAEGVLSSFLPKILALPQKEGRIAIFASHGLRLWSILTHHRLDLANKVLLCEQSVDYARCAHDPNSLVPALIELASAYEYTDQPEKRFKTLQEALYNSAHATPLVQSRAYSRNAVVLAEGGREREAHLYIGLAREVFPDDPTKDPGFAFADSSIFRFSYHAGLVRVLTGEATRANDAFELYKQHPSGAHIPDRIRLEIANGESKAAILMNDAERYADLLEEVMIGSANIGSKKRFDEAYRIFRRQMPASWLAHQRIQTLTEKYHLKREE